MILPSLRQLRYLTTLSECLNFREAASRSFVTQSTLSAGIKELENQLGVQLFERDKRSVRLTTAGEEMARRARSLLTQAADLMLAAQATSKPMCGDLKLGAIPTIAPFMLPQLLPGLRANYPQLKLYLREDQTPQLLERLRAGTLDLAIIAVPYDTSGLTLIELFHDELWFVARADDPLAKTKQVAIERLASREVVLLEEGHCLRQHALIACGRTRPKHTSLIEATSLNTLLQMVEGGLGITLLPETAIKAGVLNGTTLVARRFSQSRPSRTLTIAARPASTPLREAKIIAAFVRAERKRLVAQ